MPGMRLFGRRCSIATDDFLFIGALSFIIHLPWLVWSPVMYASYLRQRQICVSPGLFDVFLPILCILVFFSWLLGALFAIFSVKGTLCDPKPRRHVVTLVYVKLVVIALDVACAILGTVIIAKDSYCDIIGLSVLVKASVSFLWFLTILRIGVMILFYDWRASRDSKLRLQKEYFTAPVRTGTLKRWNLRLQALFLWCTTPSEARKEAIKTASELMALLSCDLDLVASDVIAGLLLYRQKCLARWKEEKQELINSPPITTCKGEKLDRFPPEWLPEWMNFRLASRYFDLGLGIFGWPWFVYRNITCGCCRLLSKLLCCFGCRHHSSKVLGDNCCGCNLAGLRATTGLIFEDLVHVSFVDRVFEVPFFVALDHETSSVLVVARGTMSVDDVLTDVSAGFASFDDPGLPPGALCHKGMLTAAREVLRKLSEGQVLEGVLKQWPGYQIIVTGHSLGASVASILTLLLRHAHSDVRCFAFAPAPTVSQAALPYSWDCIFTVIYGNDSVPFLNYENVKGLVHGMVSCLEMCNLPKYKIFLKRYEDNENEKDRPVVMVNGSLDRASSVLRSSSSSDSDIEKGGSNVLFVTESLYVGGTILHLRKVEDGHRMRLCSAEDYRPLMFRPNMILHHFPQYMQKCLRQMAEQQHVEANLLAK